MPVSSSAASDVRLRCEKMCDDVFDEDAGPRQELNLIAKEFEKINMNIEKTGFRDGFLEAKETSVQKGFDEGFQESFANHCALNKLKGITLALLMSDAESENEARDLTLESIFQQLEDIEMVLSDYEQISATGGPLAVLSAFDGVKSQLLNLVTRRAGEESDLTLQISQCPSLSFSSFLRVTTYSPDEEEVPAPTTSNTVRERSNEEELSF